MSAGGLEMRSLLEQAGFRIRGNSRADCIHCSGSSRGTVAFTPEVAFCHRCHWSANTIVLARSLGLSNHPSAEARRRAVLNRELDDFDEWRRARSWELIDLYRRRAQLALLAEDVLRRDPDNEQALDALARFYHSERTLLSAIDWLSFTKASNWLEQDSTPSEVFEVWRSRVA